MLKNFYYENDAFTILCQPKESGKIRIYIIDKSGRRPDLDEECDNEADMLIALRVILSSCANLETGTVTLP